MSVRSSATPSSIASDDDAGERERREREPVLDEHDAEHLEERRAAGRDADDPERDQREHRPLRVARLEADLAARAR